MLIYTIDDEQSALTALTDAVKDALPNAEIKQLNRVTNALSEIRKNEDRPAVVFSAIRMPGMDGLEMAVVLQTYSPDTKIVFVTAHPDCALEAFKVHASGYLLKPVLPEHIREELEHLGLISGCAGGRLRIQCFGNFEVFWDDQPLTFKRRQSKELLAYLIDREGATCTAEEVIAVLWEDESNIANAKHNLRNLVNDLRTTLCEIDQADVLIRGSGTIAVDRSKVDCDYYQMLDGDITAENSYRGEFMKQYAWAQMTEAKLHFNPNPC